MGKGEFPGGSVVRTPHFTAGGPGSIPGQGSKILKAAQHSQIFWKKKKAKYIKQLFSDIEQWVAQNNNIWEKGKEYVQPYCCPHLLSGWSSQAIVQWGRPNTQATGFPELRRQSLGEESLSLQGEVLEGELHHRHRERAPEIFRGFLSSLWLSTYHHMWMKKLLKAG